MSHDACYVSMCSPMVAGNTLQRLGAQDGQRRYVGKFITSGGGSRGVGWCFAAALPLGNSRGKTTSTSVSLARRARAAPPQQDRNTDIPRTGPQVRGLIGPLTQVAAP